MVDDHDKSGKDVPDPWADLEATGGDDATPFDIDAFTFDDGPAAQPAGADAIADQGPGDPPAGSELPAFAATGGQAAADPTAADHTIGGSTTGDDVVGVSMEMDEATGSEGAPGSEDRELIGSGAWDDPEPAVDAVERSAEHSADSFGLGEFSESSESGSEAAAAPVAVAAKKATPSRPARGRKKSSGIGQVIGIVLGGAMAIPVTLGILVWGFGKDPFDTTKHVPDQLAFLLPAKFQRRGGGGGGGIDLGLPIPKPGGERRPATTEETPFNDTAPADPSVDPVTPTTPGDDQPLADPTDTFVDPLDSPTKEPQPVVPPPPPAPPAPPPLDMARLEAAVAAADAAGAAVADVTDREDPARRPLLLDWYRQLAVVAEELVLLEGTAADTGRALAGPPEAVKTLHAGIAARAELREELSRLGPMWLTASTRKGDGVVLWVTFDSARRVGPYWSTQATLQLPKGKTRPIVVVSRGEPAAVAGDPIVVTGVILGDGVVWAADVRGTGAGDPVSAF